MLCKKCGEEISDGSAYCPKCGKKLNSSLTGSDSAQSNTTISSHLKKIAAIIFFIAVIIVVCLITPSQGTAFFLSLFSMVLCPILCIAGIIKKALKKPSGKLLYFSGMLFVVFCISLANYSPNAPNTAVIESGSIDEISTETLSDGTNSPQSFASETTAVTDSLYAAADSAEATETAAISDANHVESTETTAVTERLPDTEKTTSETAVAQTLTNDPYDSTTSDLPSYLNKGSDIIDSDVWLYNCSDFSDGRAWVEYNDEARKYGNIEMIEEQYNALTGDDRDRFEYLLSHYSAEGANKAALIDKYGKIIWESDLTRSKKVLTEASEFIDGFAYCIFSGNKGDILYIIDWNGNVTYKSEVSEDSRVICHGDGKFFIGILNTI